MDISTITVIELKAIAKKRGIAGVSRYKKAELISLLYKVKEKENNIPEFSPNKIVKTEIKVNKKIKKTKVDKINLIDKKIRDPKWNIYKKEIDEIVDELEKEFINDLKKERERFLSKGGNEIDFNHVSKEKEEFNKIKFEYRKIKRSYFKEIENKKKINSALKRNIINQIKELIGSEKSINTIYKEFKSLQKNWHNIGYSLRIDSNDLWENYKHHVERFYDFLHINRELRNIDFEHNYKEKIKIIEKAEELVKTTNIVKAGRELNILHDLWKNELGPVSPDKREDLWKRFQTASKLVHLNKKKIKKNLDENQKINLERKNSILTKINKLTDPEPSNHKEWQSSIIKFNDLRESFKSIGATPKEESKKNWELYRELGRTYNLKKNIFYKNQKNIQNETIKNYKSLLDEVKSINKKDDWNKFVNRMKSIQTDFNKLGFVPRNLLKKFRSEFQKETNLYFKRLKSGYLKLNEDEELIYNQKKELISKIRKTKFNTIEKLSNYWNDIENKGTLNNKLQIEISNLFIKSGHESITLNPKVTSDKSNIKFEIELIVLRNNLEELHVKIDYYKKLINELQTEITQLENNLDFFSKSSSESPLLIEVTKKLNLLTGKLLSSKERINKLKSFRNKIINSSKDISDELEKNNTEREKT